MEWRFSFAIRDATRGFPHSHAHRRNMEGPVYVDTGRRECANGSHPPTARRIGQIGPKRSVIRIRLGLASSSLWLQPGVSANLLLRHPGARGWLKRSRR